MNQLRIGFVGAMQANFDGGKSAAFKRSSKSLKALSEKLNFDLFIYPEFIVTAEDAEKAGDVIENERIDFLLVQTTTFAAGEIIIKLVRTAAHMGIWALPEASFEGSNFVNSNNSFCGMNMYGSILIYYLKEEKIKYKWFFGWPDDPRFLRRITVTVRALAAVKKLHKSRVALVGGIAPGFNDLYFDERIGRKKLGIEIQRNHEFSEIKERAFAYSDSEILRITEQQFFFRKPGERLLLQHV